ncbi:MAG: C10 family peptidase [bacterium]
MKKLILFLFLSTAFSWLASAKQVEENIARTVAGNFFASRIDKNQLKALPAPVLVYTYGNLKTGQDAGSKAAPAFYVYNFTGTPGGFVIVSGNDACTPILGYSTESSFQTGNIPPALLWWLQGYHRQIRDAAEKDLKATPETEGEWTALLSDVPGSSVFQKSTSAVAPLVKVCWNQEKYYNDSCPVINTSTGKRGYVGCVATSMAMIMAYHKHPVQGKGENSYTTETLKLKCYANFEKTTYNWSLMPDSLNKYSSPNSVSAVATLMYHCGVSMNINYKLDVTSGQDFAQNDPNAPCTENALKKYFGYDPSLRQEDRKDYTTDADWINMLKTDLNASRPIIYTGRDTTGGDTIGGGHSFICDGYDDYNLFHFNWGWGGSCNGNYNINNMNPPNQGTYNVGQAVLVGIKKSTLGVEDKNLSDKLVVYPNPTRGILEIKLDKGQGDDLQKTVVTSMMGKKVYESSAKAENDHISLDLSASPQGSYIITFYFNSGEKASGSFLITK